MVAAWKPMRFWGALSGRRGAATAAPARPIGGGPLDHGCSSKWLQWCWIRSDCDIISMWRPQNARVAVWWDEDLRKGGELLCIGEDY